MGDQRRPAPFGVNSSKRLSPRDRCSLMCGVVSPEMVHPTFAARPFLIES